MNRKNLIISGILIIVLVLSVWVYLLLFGAPKNIEGVFSNFNQGETVVFKEEQQKTVVTENIIPTEQILRKLTNKPTASAVFMENKIRYIERGTGYVYDIDIQSGEEIQITNTTIPRVVEAVFSKSGNKVAMTAETEGGTATMVGTITKNDIGVGVIEGVSLPNNSKEIQFSASGLEIFYLVKTDYGSTGYSYNITEQVQTTLFSVPLSDINVIWGDEIYVYTKPSNKQFGYIYIVGENKMSYVTPGKIGMTAKMLNNKLFISNTYEKSIETYMLDDFGPRKTALRLFLEKCTQNNTSTSSIYCTTPTSITSGNYPDDWYKGLVSFSDSFWNFNLNENSGELKSNFFDLSGEKIDVIKLENSPDGRYVYLINKNDDSLWLYDTTLD